VIEVTADSNIYVSALNFAGAPLRFLDAARHGLCRVAISAWIVEEVARTLRTKFLWDESRLRDALASVGDFTVMVDPPRTLRVVLVDPDDDRILECAIAAGSQYLVTGDGDLLRLGQFQGVRIIKVAEFLTFLPAS
jgi:putative PIN family toxin of toxin-antitoxin system